MLQTKGKVFYHPIRFYFSNIQFLKNDLTAFIAPFSASPYYRTFGTESFLSDDQISIMNERLSTLIQSITTSTRQQNKFLKDLQLNRDKPIYNIEFPENIEISLREKLINLNSYVEQQSMKFKIKIDQTQWKQTGQLEIYGVLPYRHFNHYISDYIISEEQEGKIRFKVKEEEQIQQKKSKPEKPEEIVKNVVTMTQEDAKITFFKKARSSANQITNLIFNKKPEPKNVDVSQKVKSIKESLLKQTQGEEHILVRDYQCDINGLFCLELDNKLLDVQNNQWVSEKDIPMKYTLRIRTEAWINKKESPVSKKVKTQVVTDFNWVMRGNPWAWVKRFDED